MILVGDNEQLQSIEAGGSFRGIIQRTGYVELAEIRRQKVEWQKEATIGFSGKQDQVEKALEYVPGPREYQRAYDKGRSQRSVDERLGRVTGLNIKQRTSLMIAYTNKDVADLNHWSKAIQENWPGNSGVQSTQF